MQNGNNWTRDPRGFPGQTMVIKMKNVVLENAASWLLSNFAWFCFGVSLVTLETWLKLGAACAALVASYFSVRASRSTMTKNSKLFDNGEDKDQDN